MKQKYVKLNEIEIKLYLAESEILKISNMKCKIARRTIGAKAVQVVANIVKM